MHDEVLGRHCACMIPEVLQNYEHWGSGALEDQGIWHWGRTLSLYGDSAGGWHGMGVIIFIMVVMVIMVIMMVMVVMVIVVVRTC